LIQNLKMQTDDPLLIFYSFAARDTFERGLGLQKSLSDPIEIQATPEFHHLLDMYTFRTIHGTACSLYVNVCRAPGGQAGFLEKARSLYNLFNGPVFIFHRELRAFAEAPPHVFINFPIQPVLDVLRIGGVSDLEKARMASCVGPAPAAGGGGGAHPRHLRTRLFSPHPPQTLTGINMRLEEEEVIAGLAEAIRQSEEEYARAQAAQKPPLPKRDWQSVLKQPEKAETGQPQCNVCFENRASICIVACGHQSMCDACVQQLVKHQCIICRAEFDQIVRPIVTLVAPPPPPPLAAEAKEPKKKRQCIKRGVK